MRNEHSLNSLNSPVKVPKLLSLKKSRLVVYSSLNHVTYLEKLVLIIPLLTSLAAASPVQCDTKRYITVITSSGLVTGHLVNQSAFVLEYLGIPYAKPPVRDLRIKPRQRFNFMTAYEAKAFGYDRPLSSSKAIDYPGKAPQAQESSRILPVLQALRRAKIV